jgi:ornithine cyclodeaminase/alanine dehydrogenase-like protein (mu-crystallin family)
MTTLLLSEIEIANIVRAVGFDRLMDETIDGIRNACLEFSPDNYSIPVRTGFFYEKADRHGLIEWMPVIRYDDRVVVKLVGYHPDNPRQFDLPTVISSIVTLDTHTGQASSIIDGTLLTSIRTGAASAVASSVLAAPNSKTLGLIGAGAQAVTQLHALCRQYAFEKILIHDTDIVACNSLAHRAGYAGIAVPIESTAVDVLIEKSDIICTSTSIGVGHGPLFEDGDLKDSVHINAVGSDFPGKTELPISLLRRSLVCPDFPDQAIREGECQQLEITDIGPSLVELVQDQGQYCAYRNKPTVFDSTGWALEDLIAADILTRLGTEAGYGTPVDLACLSEDAKNPYGFIDRYLEDEERLAAEGAGQA